MTRVPAVSFTLLAGDLSMYQYNSKVAKHYFCKICGIYTFHRLRTAPGLYDINVGCLDGVDPLSLEINLNNGQAFSIVSPA
jgi:hypothetical protein